MPMTISLPAGPMAVSSPDRRGCLQRAGFTDILELKTWRKIYFGLNQGEIFVKGKESGRVGTEWANGHFPGYGEL